MRIISAVICAVIGVVWVGQGAGFVRGSMMTGDIRWGAAGLVLLALAVWQLVVLLRTSKARP